MTKYVITITIPDGFASHQAREFIGDWLSRFVASAHTEQVSANIAINMNDTEVIMHKGYDC